MATPVTLTPSYSFYVRESRPDLVSAAARFGDAITIAGPKGPKIYLRGDERVRTKPVLFDGEGYRNRYDYDTEDWVNAQRRAGADRAMLPGVLVPWDKSDPTILETSVRDQAQVAADLGATMVLAVDSRWLSKRSGMLVDLLGAADCATALVLAHRSDPLSSTDAVMGLRAIARSVRRLSILRSDHGAVGGLAYGAVHASIGLTSGTRHFAPPAMNPQSFGDRSARLFLLELLDWYRASEVAGWIAGGVPVTCTRACCAGARLDRFLDPDSDAVSHNLHCLANFAEYILDADPVDRTGLFAEACRNAVGRYGTGWFRGPTDPKAQLSAWALS